MSLVGWYVVLFGVPVVVAVVAVGSRLRELRSRGPEDPVHRPRL